MSWGLVRILETGTIRTRLTAALVLLAALPLLTLAVHLFLGSKAAHSGWRLEVVTAALALAVLGLTLWAVRRVVLGPLPALTAALGQVGSGRYGIQVESRSQNEIGTLVRGFNSMSSTLERVHEELVMKQSEVLEKNSELERANRLKSEFVANMSHELRTPLHAVIGYTKLLRSGAYGVLPEPMSEPLQGIDETSGALLLLINDILDVAKIEAGRMDLHLESFRAHEVVDEAAELLKPLAQGKGLELVVHVHVPLPAVTCDRDKLRRIVLNLAANAIKFTRQGRVEIELRDVPVGPVGADHGFEIAVTDTGIGIAPENLDLVFEDFRQVDGSSRREQGGTGLGLAIALRLARQLGGDLRVQSRLGSGSTFTLKLPLHVRNPSAPSPPPDGARARYSGSVGA